MARHFYLARLIDADGSRLASEEVWTPEEDMIPDGYDLAIDFTPERVVLDAASFFSTDDHGALDLDGCTIQLFGPYTVGEPTASFAISEEPDPMVNEFYHAARILPPEPTITTVRNSGGLWAAWYEDGSIPPGRAFGHKTEAEAVAALKGEG